MTSITFHGGATEIGGNKILVEDSGTRVFLDFGMNLAERKKFYTGFHMPKDARSLVELGIIPHLEGVYRFDDSSRKVDAVILSHAHVDHFGCISLLKRDIDVYASAPTIDIIQAVTETRHRSIESDLNNLKLIPFESGKSFKIGDIQITPHPVDHSIPGAHGFILETSSGPVGYTGDFRLHGRNAKLTRNFIAQVHKVGPTALLCEGTNILSGDSMSEQDVLREAGQIVARASGLVLANFSAVDIDRLKSLHRVAKDTDRRLALTPRHAYVLSRLKSNREAALLLRSSNLSVFRKQKSRYEKWETAIFREVDCVTSDHVKHAQQEWIVASSMYDVAELLVEMHAEPGSVFVYSSSEPFDEEMEESYEVFRNWLVHFGIPLYSIHSSGHMMPVELRRSILQMSPERLFTIHTPSQRIYSKFLGPDVKKIVEPKQGETHSLP